MDGFDAALANWEPFYGAQIPAGAALLGLLFVALSLNLDGIIGAPSLSRRAEIALLLILLQLVASSIALMPDQPAWAFAVEILLVAGFVWVATLGLSVNLLRHVGAEQRALAVMNIALLQVALLPFIVGGALVIFERGPALHLIAAGTILCVAKAALDAWVLLVEIKR